MSGKFTLFRGFRCSASLYTKLVSRGESKRRLVLHPCIMKPISMGFIPSAVFALEKSHPCVFHQLRPRSRAPVGVSSSKTASASTASLGQLLADIVMETIRAFIRILFPVAQNLRFIASLLTIWEQIGFSTIESLRSLVRVLGCMIPTLALRNIPNIGSVQGVVVVIRKYDYVQDALESDRGVIDEKHSRAHLSDAFLI